MSKHLTAEEKRFVRRLKQLCQDWPKDLRLYVIDGGDITICKRGVSSDDFSETFGCPSNAGNYLSGLHDDDPHNGVNR